MRQRLTLLLLALFAVACSRNDSADHWRLRLSVATDGIGADSVWYVWTYSSNAVTIDTLTPTAKGHIKWEQTWLRDTLDGVLLYNSRGELLAPLFPALHSREAKVSSTKKSGGPLTLTGLLQSEDVARWVNTLRLSHPNNVAKADTLATTLRQIERGRVRAIIATALIAANDTTAPGTRLRQAALPYLYEATDLIPAIGGSFDRLSQLAGARRQRLMLSLPNEYRLMGDDVEVTIKSIAGGKREVLYQFFPLPHPSDSLASDSLRRYIKRIDSLGLGTLTVLPESDDRPTTWARRTRGKGAKHLLLIDSIGHATDFALRAQVLRLPTYLVVDTLGFIRHEWYHPDSVLTYFSSPKRSQP